MKPSIRLHIERIDGMMRQDLLVELREIPAGMTPKRCAVWMLARAMERLREPETHPAKRD